ncbi:MAG: hypothetical protein HC905_19035 [Bacteroidales bacterium]|nr:hypothetical protein [Bacteroidales bacterium]
MKIATVLLIVGMLNIYAKGYSQQEKITVHRENASLKEIMVLIENESGYKFLYNDDYSGLEKIISLNVTQKPVREVLEQILDGTGAGFKLLDNKLIVVVPELYLSQQQVLKLAVK